VKWKVLDIYTRAGNKNGDRNDAKVSDLWSKKTTREQKKKKNFGDRGTNNNTRNNNNNNNNNNERFIYR